MLCTHVAFVHSLGQICKRAGGGRLSNDESCAICVLLSSGVPVHSPGHFYRTAGVELSKDVCCDLCVCAV